MSLSSSPPLSAPQAPDVITDPATGRRFWTIGTLRYTKAGLITLFFWLMWNDFFLMLLEAVKPALTGLLMRSHGATNTQIALTGTVATVFTIWINPVVSTWSDRTRTSWGRRRPFLLIAAPPAALFLGLIPWAPEAWNWLMGHAWFAELFPPGSINGAVVAIAACGIVFGIFNAVLMGVFQYFYWDVVPKSVLGRFNATVKIVTTIQTFVWNYWIFGHAQNHMKWVYGLLAGLCLAAYMVSLFVVKEGDYPPPEPRPKKTFFAPFKSYVTDCFSHGYYWWIFGAFIAYQLGNLPNLYRLFHWSETIALDLDTIGKMQAWPTLGIVLLGYPLGALLDRFQPVRLVAVGLLMWAASNVVSFFFLRDATSLLVCMGLITLSQFVYGICVGVVMVEVFPREKIGQFSSANNIVHSIITFVLTPFVGMFFDWVNNYTYAYLWSATCQLVAAALFVKVYFNWRRRKLAEAATSSGPSFTPIPAITSS
ncbi:MAG: hypothetical protein K0R17_2728 [Rariglobus sp.]|jgi:Na+/melibiose symporter-like transporter|nr:hypothetical protein [Rariglobus sp.]